MLFAAWTVDVCYPASSVLSMTPVDMMFMACWHGMGQEGDLNIHRSVQYAKCYSSEFRPEQLHRMRW